MKINPNNLRKHVLDMVYAKKSGHIGGSFSLAELIAIMYETYDFVSDSIDRDRLILSKGHAVPIIYAVLYELGILSREDIETFREINSKLQGHPDKVRMNIFDATTGSLGQGLSIAIGHALAYKMKKFNTSKKIFCIIGDGEIQEGQIWEAIMFAPKYKLNNLVCILDNNGAQNDDYTSKTLDLGNISNKVAQFNWETYTINGHDAQQIIEVFDSLKFQQKPVFIIANTIKGRGVSFMENPEWHAKVPNESEYNKALGEIINA